MEGKVQFITGSAQLTLPCFREEGNSSSTNELSKPVGHDKQVMNGLCTLAM